MRQKWCSLALFLLALIARKSVLCSSTREGARTLTIQADPDDPGQALFITPYLEANKAEEARKLSRVSFDGFEDVPSYSGFFTVNKTYNSSLYFWFFPAANGSEDAPVVLWLQGGPGASSLFGLFVENGPYRVDKKGLQRRKYAWTDNHNVIYIDNPAGTGFSFTDKEEGYAKNEEDVGRDLYEALVQFFQLFPDLQKNDFFVTGESYAGKYVPACSYRIHKNNPSAKLKINFKGMAIGNGLSDPEHQMKYSDYLFQLGLLDACSRDAMKAMEQQIVQDIQNKQWEAAFDKFDRMLLADLTEQPSFFTNMTGFTSYFNYLQTNGSNEGNELLKYVSRPDIRRAIHVGNLSYKSESRIVEKHLKLDLMQSVAPWVAEIIDHYRVLIYNGQLDIIVAYPLTVNYLANLKFGAADEYAKAKRHIWKVDKKVAGYAKMAGNLVEVMVRDAGHMVPHDQPKWAWDLITRFTRGKSLF